MRRRSLDEKMDDNCTGSFDVFGLPSEGFLPHALGVPLYLKLCICHPLEWLWQIFLIVKRECMCKETAYQRRLCRIPVAVIFQSWHARFWWGRKSKKLNIKYSSCTDYFYLSLRPKFPDTRDIGAPAYSRIHCTYSRIHCTVHKSFSDNADLDAYFCT